MTTPRDLPSRDSLRQILEYDPDSGWLSWKERPGEGRESKRWNARYAGALAGKLDRHGYRHVRLTDNGERRTCLAHRIAWKIHTGEEPPEVIDHDDGDVSNNAWHNLKDGTRGANSRNRWASSKNTSGEAGVCWHKASGKWAAQVGVSYKRIHLGVFANIEDARDAYRMALASYGFSERHGSKKPGAGIDNP